MSKIMKTKNLSKVYLESIGFINNHPYNGTDYTNDSYKIRIHKNHLYIADLESHFHEIFYNFLQENKDKDNSFWYHKSKSFKDAKLPKYYITNQGNILERKEFLKRQIKDTDRWLNDEINDDDSEFINGSFKLDYQTAMTLLSILEFISIEEVVS